MSSVVLTDELARVLGWKAGPDRYMKPGRQWIPKWRFNPLNNVEDALQLLDALDPEEYSMGASRGGGFWVHVRLRAGAGQALETSKPRAISLAVARALGIKESE